MEDFFEMQVARLMNQVRNLNASFVLLNCYYELEQCQGKLYPGLIASV